MFSVKVSSPQILCFVIFGFIFAFILSFAVGANDVANFFGTVVGTNAITMKQMFVVASISELSGAMLLGHTVSDTIRKGIVSFDSVKSYYRYSPKCLYPNITTIAKVPPGVNGTIACPELITMEMAISALIGSSTWLFIANILKLPVSTTHSIVGSTLGAGLVALEGKGVIWKEVGLIVASWVVSPLLSGLLSVIVYFALWKLVMERDNSFNLMLKVVPGIYFITVFINVFSVVYDGSPFLRFDKVPWYGVLILSVGLGAIAALLCIFVINPYIKNKILKNLNKKTDASEICDMKKVPLVATKGIPVTVTFDNGVLKSTTEQQVYQIEDSTDKGVSEVESKSKKLSILFNAVRSCKDSRTDELFVILQILIACVGSFVHGGNDISNSISPLLSIWQVYSTQELAEKANPAFWILFYGGAGIVLGLILMGSRVIATIGKNITKLTPSSSFAIEFGAALTVLIATKLGLPISTTHCQVGSVVFVGMLQQGVKSIDYKLMTGIVISWLVTLPVAGLVSGGAFYAIRYFVYLSLQ